MDNINSISVIKKLTEIKLKNDNGFIKVVGFSMQPLLYENYNVKLKKCNKYKTGDVVVVVDNLKRLLVHRIVNIKDEKIYTKGDNAVAVETVEYNNCIGKVILILNEKNEEHMLKGGLKSKLIAFLSMSMNKKWIKSSYNGAPAFGSLQRKLIIKLDKVKFK